MPREIDLSDDPQETDPETFDTDEEIGNAGTPSALREEFDRERAENPREPGSSDSETDSVDADEEGEEKADPSKTAPESSPSDQKLDRLLSVLERTLTREPAREQPREAPAPKKGLHDQFQENEDFRNRAMRVAGYEPDEHGNYERAAIDAVGAKLYAEDLKIALAVQSQSFEEARRQDQFVGLAQRAEELMGVAMPDFDQLPARVQLMIAQSLSAMLAEGITPRQAVNLIVDDFKGLRGKTDPKPSAQAPASRAPATAPAGKKINKSIRTADGVVSVPRGGKPTAPKPKTPAQRKEHLLAMRRRITSS